MSEHSSVPLCGDCGQRPSLSVWRRRCDPCFESFLLRANQAKWDFRRHWAGFDAPGLPGRILRALAWDAAHENMDAVPWVERLTDDAFLRLRNMGPKSLARFREIVAAPTMEPDGALAAATARAEKAEAEVRRLRAIGRVEYDGAMAFLTGIPLESNPHREPGEDWHIWRQGYQRVSDRERVRNAEARAAELLAAGEES